MLEEKLADVPLKHALCTLASSSSPESFKILCCGSPALPLCQSYMFYVKFIQDKCELRETQGA